jgi:hypothetical protein
MFAWDKYSNLLRKFLNNDLKSFMTFAPGLYKQGTSCTPLRQSPDRVSFPWRIVNYSLKKFVASGEDIIDDCNGGRILQVCRWNQGILASEEGSIRLTSS